MNRPPVPPDDLYSANADLIERVIERSCRAHRLPADAADEFRSWARLRLLDHDQAILRKFGGRSTLRTFLLTVVERLFLDWRNHEWGKWRPSNEARRLGDLAIELEKLVLRDHYTVYLARAGARERHGGRDRTEAQETVLVEALERVILALPASDQIVLRLRFWSGFKISRIAELIGEDPKALYRRFDRACVELKLRLEAEGVRVDSRVASAGTSRCGTCLGTPGAPSPKAPTMSTRWRYCSLGLPGSDPVGHLRTRHTMPLN